MLRTGRRVGDLQGPEPGPLHNVSPPSGLTLCIETMDSTFVLLQGSERTRLVRYGDYKPDRAKRSAGARHQPKRQVQEKTGPEIYHHDLEESYLNFHSPVDVECMKEH